MTYWNTHKIRKQKNKSMPSGATPTDIFTSPGVDAEFDEGAYCVYAKLGSPKVTSFSAWTVFQGMAPLIFHV